MGNGCNLLFVYNYSTVIDISGFHVYVVNFSIDKSQNVYILPSGNNYYRMVRTNEL